MHIHCPENVFGQEKNAFLKVYFRMKVFFQYISSLPPDTYDTPNSSKESCQEKKFKKKKIDSLFSK